MLINLTSGHYKAISDIRSGRMEIVRYKYRLCQLVCVVYVVCRICERVDIKAFTIFFYSPSSSTSHSMGANESEWRTNTQSTSHCLEYLRQNVGSIYYNKASCLKIYTHHDHPSPPAPIPYPLASATFPLRRSPCDDLTSSIIQSSHNTAPSAHYARYPLLLVYNILCGYVRYAVYVCLI